MSKTETTSKVSLKLRSRMNLWRRGTPTELSILDTAHKLAPPSPNRPQAPITDPQQDKPRKERRARPALNLSHSP